MRLKRTLRVSLATAAAIGALASSALALPQTLLGAVQKAYGTRNVHIAALCHESIGGRSYNLVDVKLIDGRRSRRAAFAYRRTGWRGVWKDGKIMQAVPKSQHVRVRAAVKELRRFCGR